MCFASICNAARSALACSNSNVATTPFVLPPAYFAGAATPTTGASASITAGSADAGADADARGTTEATTDASVLGTFTAGRGRATAKAAGPITRSTITRMATLTPRQAKKARFALATGSKA